MSRAVLALVALVAAGCTAQGPEPGPRPWGQWIWSGADRAVFVESRRALPDLLPGVWVSTLAYAEGRVTQRLALSPALEPGARVAIVVRLDESVHAAWDGGDEGVLADAIGARLAVLLGHVAATGVTVAEVQLDYDCPERRLSAWAGVVRRLAAGPLAGREVWLTSLVAHLRHREYGDLFRPSVAGHILQVFDTGDRADPFSVRTVREMVARARMPFRLGVGAYERVRGGVIVTDHRRWFAAVEPISKSRWFRGVWVFPAGRPWTLLAERVS